MKVGQTTSIQVLSIIIVATRMLIALIFLQLVAEVFVAMCLCAEDYEMRSSVYA